MQTVLPTTLPPSTLIDLPGKQTNIPWEGYFSAQLITNEEFDAIKTYSTILSQDKPEPEKVLKYYNIWISLLNRLQKTDTINSILYLFEELVQDPYRLSVCLASSEDPIPVLLSKMDKWKGDQITPWICLKIIAEIVCFSQQRSVWKKYRSHDVRIIFDILYPYIAEMNSQKSSEFALEGLQAILAVKEIRQQYMQQEKYTEVIAKKLKTISEMESWDASSIQKQYQLSYILWLVSFEPKMCEIINKYRTCGSLLRILRRTTKEKVARISISLIYNLWKGDKTDTLNALVGFHAHTLFESLKFNDDDMKEDIKQLDAAIQEHVLNLSTFDHYAAEITSGNLEWSPVHTSDIFWKFNASKFMEMDGALIKSLARLLSASSKPEVLAICCHDIGQVLKYCPDSKK
eukprot:NODE_208_length_12861_cov_0.800972.p3 type:complete len:403 gc:universal NODE_208_length_12861_cov_0.800972:10845-9637(-)